jgi:pilus assembly protein CpaB
MNRRNRTLIVVGVAVLLASLASYGVYSAIMRIPVREVPIATYHAVVAKVPVPVGSLITADQVQLVAWPADAPVAGGFTKVEDVIGRGLMTSVVQNEVITENKLAPKLSGGGLPPMITPGMRAMAVRINDIIGVSGFIQPGSRVDIMVTLKPEGGPITRDFLSNIQVLASGPRIDNEQQRDGKAVSSSVVTVLVSPQDAERLALAANEGSIVLALRNPLDTDPVETQGARMSALLGGTTPPPQLKVVKGQTRAVAPPPPPPAPKPYTVETIKGAKRSEEIIK